jgi:hypothetical protein
MVWLMRFRAAVLIVALVFALGLVALAFFPGLRKRIPTWVGGAAMSRPSRLVFWGLFICVLLGALLRPYRLSEPPRTLSIVTLIFITAMFVFAIYDRLAPGIGGDRHASEEDAPSDNGTREDRKPVALNTDLNLRYMPWFFWLGLAMEAAGGIMMLVAHTAPGPKDEYALVPGLLVFIMGTGAMVLGTWDAKRRAKE